MNILIELSTLIGRLDWVLNLIFEMFSKYLKQDYLKLLVHQFKKFLNNPKTKENPKLFNQKNVKLLLTFLPNNPRNKVFPPPRNRFENIKKHLEDVVHSKIINFDIFPPHTRTLQFIIFLVYSNRPLHTICPHFFCGLF